MSVLEQTARYREYLRSFGIVEAGDRIAELRDLDFDGVRFFAYAGDEGLRLKAAIANGLITPGGHAADDWYEFLSRMPSALAAAERIAWLETDASMPPHALPSLPTVTLAPDRRLSADIDPAQWSLITSPTLRIDSVHGVELIAWFLTRGTRIPTRWTIKAPRAGVAKIDRTSALDLL